MINHTTSYPYEDCKDAPKYDYEDCHTPNTTVEETVFTTPNSTSNQSTLTLLLKQKVKGDNLAAALYSQLNAIDDLELINLNQFNYVENTKKSTRILKFYNGDKCVRLTKKTAELLAPEILRDRFGAMHAMKQLMKN